MNRLQAAALLGVDSNASASEAKKAYTSRARLLHPDRFAGASEADIAAATTAMAQLNQAYEVFTSGGGSSTEPQGSSAVVIACVVCGRRNRVPESARAANCSGCGSALELPWTSTSSAGANYGFPVWSDARTACDLCGWGPAQAVTFRTVSGVIIWWRWGTFEGHLCRECSNGMYHDAQTRTLTRGWWGIIAPLASLLALLLNWLQYRESRGLPSPQGRCPTKLALLPVPMFIVRPWWKRPLPIVATLVAAFIIWVVIASFMESSSSSSLAVGSDVQNSAPESFTTEDVSPQRPSSSGPIEPAALRTGDCIETKIGSRVQSLDLIPCTQPHIYEVVGVKSLGSSITSADQVESAANDACNSYFENYVGLPVMDTNLTWSYLAPNNSNPFAPNRRITCLVHNLDETLMTGSLRR